MRYDNWRFVVLEQRAVGTLNIWAELYTQLRVPQIFTLRATPFERAGIASSWDSLSKRTHRPGPARAVAGAGRGHVHDGFGRPLPGGGAYPSVRVDSSSMDAEQVTNAEFARFVGSRGYTTVAGRPISAQDYPGAPPENLVPGSLVFTPTSGPGSSVRRRASHHGQHVGWS